MRSLEHSGWFLINIAVPLLAPLALLPLARLPNFFREHSRGVFRRAIGHGQMLWAALPMSASACYMLSGAIGGSSPDYHLSLAYLGAHICVIALSAAGIVLGAMESCMAASGTPCIANGILRYSLVLTSITATLYFLAYLHVVQPATT
ncbi:hypothetical protein [Cupriavidus pauculus]|uniref:Uncharacterized protein n=1 Tax=Cupriavidus pauculus TaxID=82633 RepID=A0A2N5CHH8_9BURK|nr:hypothetical protein [Cupriavidus pauculus]PLQ01651.1 hypothetical protein CYJ10_08260 [Cupriavidus pauculus]